MKLDVLAIGAHPDDVELSCGGTIVKLVRQGKAVGLLDLTEGELGTRGSREIRAEEAAEAARILGVSLRETASIPDGNIENNEDNRSRVIRVIRAYRPDVLLIPYHTDRHPDHEHAHTLCREAWFYAGLEKLKTDWNGVTQQPHRPKIFYCFMHWHEFQPTFIVDISAEFEQRMKAVRAFASQFFNPHSRERETALSAPGFLEMVETRLAYYGDRIGVAYGEPFNTSQVIHVSDITKLHV